MDDPLGLAILILAALVVAIVALAKLIRLGASIEELKRRLSALELGAETAAPKSAPTKPAVPPPLPAYVTQTEAAGPRMATPVPAEPHRAFNWESILGVKLFAWIGGFALFLGVVFFVKYAFDNNWITPAMRIVAGAIVGVGLVIVSLLPRVQRYRIPAQSVCATGILILYADVYAAHAFYNLIPLTATIALMWIVTAIALYLALYVESQAVAWLGVIGGFVIPFLFQTNYSNAISLFVYVGVLSCAASLVGALRRWNYLVLVAAIASIGSEVGWAADFFGEIDGETTRFAFLWIQALFLAISVALTRVKLSNSWSLAAAALTGFVVLLFFIIAPGQDLHSWDFGFLTLLLGNAGLIALAAHECFFDEKSRAAAVIVAIALLLTWLAEWSWHASVFSTRAWVVTPRLGFLVEIFVAIFLLFAVTPYCCGSRRVWPWMIAAIAGPLQFLFVHEYMRIKLVPNNWLWLPTLAFALPAATGVWYLVKKEHVDLASGDSRLATQGAAVLAFVSLVFPVQFRREWITLGWAIEGLLLILLFRWIPNRRLRVVALMVLVGAFVRLAINPAVLEYHPRTHVPIWNWYLYAYGVGAVCLFLSACWFGAPKEKQYEKIATPFLYSLAGIVLFLLMNIEIADYFSIGPTLTFSFSGNFARDMSYTIAWSLFAFCLLVLGIARNVRAARLVAIGLLLITFAKLFLHDLDSLTQLYRIVAFIAVALIAIVASFVYQRFLMPRTKT